MSIALVGAPGAGKTTAGRMLAQSRALVFTDVDKLIEERVGKPIAEIFADEGEAEFRRLEELATIKALGEGGVVSLGGGAVLNERIREALLGHTVIWLVVSIGRATRRVGMNQARPLLLGNVRGQLIRLLRQREPLYAAVATMQIDTDELDVNQVVQVIEASLEAQL